MRDLHSYDISADTGYLCSYDASKITLSGLFKTAQTIAPKLPQMLPSGTIRQYLTQNLPTGDFERVVQTLTNPQARMAMVYYSFMVQSYVWGEATPPHTLPKCLGSCRSPRPATPPAL